MAHTIYPQTRSYKSQNYRSQTDKAPGFEDASPYLVAAFDNFTNDRFDFHNN